MVKAWREAVVIPTYKPGKPEKNPIFLEKRVYQGSSGVVYPYPVIESIADEKEDVEYQAIFLENEYIKVMILPELGGRVQMAYDKIKQRHFIYYNQVIKPALVGLAGPWISGGIEFNWPQHHRPSTFMPVDSCIEENKDGSVTVWVNERERMFHQQGQAGFTLRPGCAYLEIKGRLYNPTEVPQTFLWWANPAVAVNDHYQSVFPPDVNAVFDHGKRAVSSFPIATGTYYKMDYSAGVDISNYKNIFVPTSYMVAKSKYNFEGGYENDTKGGMLHVADHHVAPGKKQWTWGNGDFGRAWDRNLTDEDGPYIELMAGVFTENQPDFTWLIPYEEKSFVQYFMPYRELGIVKNASKDLIMNYEDDVLKVLATSRMTVRIKAGSFDKEVELSPEEVFIENLEASKPRSLESSNPREIECIEILRLDGKLLLSWQPEPDEIRSIPDAAEPALRPEEIKTTEQLYLTGLHLEQYRHATFCALDYYEEALRRDPLDVRNNNAVGLWYLRRGRFAKAEPYFRTAVRVLQKRNLNPYDGEPLYNLALCLKYQAMASVPCDSVAGQRATVASVPCSGVSCPSSLLDEAYDWAYKSTWNAAWQGPGFLLCAQIATARGDYELALEHIDKSLIYGWHNHKARALKAALLHRLETSPATVLAEASVSSSRAADSSADGQERPVLGLSMAEFAAESLSLNPFNYAILFEQDRIEEMKQLMRRDANNYDELALDYVAAGLWQDAIAIWGMAIEESAVTPMTRYYMAWAATFVVTSAASVPSDSVTGQQATVAGGSAAGILADAAAQSPDFCFPNRLEAVLALEAAKALAPNDAHAPYFLGNLYYDKRQYDLAQQNWELSARLDDSFPTVHRNLALLYFNKRNDKQAAVAEMQRAFALDQTDGRILMELDQLYKRLGRPHQERLAFLEKYPELIKQRDDLLLEHITLLNLTGRYEEAMRELDAHQFHPWEGGEGKVPAQYQLSRVELAKQALEERPVLGLSMAEQEATVAAGSAASQPCSVPDGSNVSQPCSVPDGSAVGLLTACLTYPHHLGEGKLHGALDNDFLFLLGLAYKQQGDEEKARDCWQRGTIAPMEPAAALYYNDAAPDKLFYAALCERALGKQEEENGNPEAARAHENRARSRFNRLISYGEQHLNEEQKPDYFAVSLPDLLVWDGDLTETNRIHSLYMLALGHYGMGNKEKAEKYLEEAEQLNPNHLGLFAFRSFMKMAGKG